MWIAIQWRRGRRGRARAPGLGHRTVAGVVGVQPVGGPFGGRIRSGRAGSRTAASKSTTASNTARGAHPVVELLARGFDFGPTISAASGRRQRRADHLQPARPRARGQGTLRSDQPSDLRGSGSGAPSPRSLIPISMTTPRAPGQIEAHRGRNVQHRSGHATGSSRRSPPTPALSTPTGGCPARRFARQLCAHTAGQLASASTAVPRAVGDRVAESDPQRCVRRRHRLRPTPTK